MGLARELRVKPVKLAEPQRGSPEVRSRAYADHSNLGL